MTNLDFKPSKSAFGQTIKRVVAASLCSVTVLVGASTMPTLLSTTGMVSVQTLGFVGAAQAQSLSHAEISDLIGDWGQARTRLADVKSMIGSLQEETNVAVKEITERAAKIGQIENDIRAGRASKANAENELSEALATLNGPRGAEERAQLEQAQTNLNTAIENATVAKAAVQETESQIVNIRSTIEKLTQAVAASDASAAAARTVAEAAEAAQAALSTSSLDGDGTQALDTLESDFFVQARAQAEAAQKSADVVKNALVLTQEKLARTENKLTANLEALDAANAAVEQAYAAFATADQAVTKVESEEEAIKQRLQAEVVEAEERLNAATSALQVAQQTLADERAALQGLSQSLETGQALSSSLQSDLAVAQGNFDTLENQLRSAQRSRLEQDAVVVASLDADLNDTLRKVAGPNEAMPQVYNRYLLPASQVFDADSAELSESGAALFNRLSQEVEAMTQDLSDEIEWVLRVETHSDGSFFEGNDRSLQSWELSQKRSLTLVRQLIENTEISPQHLAGGGFGEFEPMADSQKALFANGKGFVELSLTTR